MTEREKMSAGMLYNSMADKSLLNDRQKAKKLCREYNDADPLDMEKRTEIMSRILGKAGGNFWMERTRPCPRGQ